MEMQEYDGRKIETDDGSWVKKVVPPFVYFSNGGVVNVATGQVTGPQGVEAHIRFTPALPAWTERVFRLEPQTVPDMTVLNLGHMPFARVVIQRSPVTSGEYLITAVDEQSLYLISDYKYEGELTMSSGTFSIGHYDVQSAFSLRDTQRWLAAPPICTLTIRVPHGTTINASGSFNTLQIGDIGGDVYLDLACTKEVTVGKIRQAQISNSGTGLIRTAAASHDIDIYILQSGGVHIGNDDKAGHKFVKVTTYGSGSVNVIGTCTEATITSEGTGRVEIGNSVRKPVISSNGECTIVVGGWT